MNDEERNEQLTLGAEEARRQILEFLRSIGMPDVADQVEKVCKYPHY